MPYPENTPGAEDLLKLPAGEIAKLPVELLAAMQRAIDAAARRMKAVTARFDTALELRYATPAAEARRASGKDTGTVRLIDGDFTVVADLPKRIDWDQEKLARMAAGSSPEAAMPAAILASFSWSQSMRLGRSATTVNSPSTSRTVPVPLACRRRASAARLA